VTSANEVRPYGPGNPDPACDAPPESPTAEPIHDERCCMAGIAPGSGPHPDCPGRSTPAVPLLHRLTLDTGNLCSQAGGRATADPAHVTCRACRSADAYIWAGGDPA
jgi:hypothetical protein